MSKQKLNQPDVETNNVSMYEPNSVEEYLDLIIAIGIDYDGYSQAEDLKQLIDELVGLTNKARKCLVEKKFYDEVTNDDNLEYIDREIMFTQNEENIVKTQIESTPKKVKELRIDVYDDFDDGYYCSTKVMSGKCPNCNNQVVDQNYCENCGQKLDWSTEND